MPKSLPPFAWMVILMLGTLLGIMGLFGAVFWHPNDYLMHNAGDGLKAYAALEYYLRYQDWSLWHEGMQYPFGNYLLFVDMNPLLALILHPLNQIFPLDDYTRGWVNLSMMLAFFPAAWAWWKLLLEIKLPKSWALLGAWLILFLSPQIQRITGHFSLGYAFFIPICWLFIIRLIDHAVGWKLRLGFAGFLLLMGLTHPYYLLLGFGFLFLYVLVHAWQFRDRTKWPVYLIALGLGIMPLLLIKVMEWTIVSGSFVTVPYGIAKYHAGFESVFIPMYEPFLSWWNEVISVKKRDWEGYAYIGLPGLIFTFYWLGRSIRLLRRKLAIRVRRPALPAPLRTAIWVAVIILIPAYAYPFQWQPDWVAWLGPLAQFRSTGRLAWIFYSVFMALNWWALYAFYRRWRIRGQAWKGLLLTGLALTSWSLAIWSLWVGNQAKFLPNHISQFPEQNRELPLVLNQAQVDPSEFQALLVLPFFHIGSEKFTLDAWKSERYGYVGSLDTGLPLINSRTARASLEHSQTTIQSVAHPLIPKILPTRFPDKRPILLLVGQEIKRPRGIGLIAQAELLGNWQEMSVYRLPVDAFAKANEAARIKVKADLKNLHELEPGLFAMDSTAFLIQNSFGDAAITLGEAVFESNQEKVLFEGSLPPGSYEVSFWARIGAQKAYFPGWRIRQYQGDQHLRKTDGYGLRSVDIQDNWVRIHQTFTLLPQTDRVQIELSPGYLVDNLLIRPIPTDVYQLGLDGSVLLFNNYFY